MGESLDTRQYRSRRDFLGISTLSRIASRHLVKPVPAFSRVPAQGARAELVSLHESFSRILEIARFIALPHAVSLLSRQNCLGVASTCDHTPILASRDWQKKSSMSRAVL